MQASRRSCASSSRSSCQVASLRRTVEPAKIQLLHAPIQKANKGGGAQGMPVKSPACTESHVLERKPGQGCISEQAVAPRINPSKSPFLTAMACSSAARAGPVQLTRDSCGGISACQLVLRPRAVSEASTTGVVEDLAKHAPDTNTTLQALPQNNVNEFRMRRHFLRL